tara:strand:+ start:461 stop:805 length:345 start_codon:yes stop_codon:yes gene_type:complete
MSFLSIFKLKLIKESSDEEEESLFEDLSDEVKSAVNEVLSRHGLEVLGTEMTSHPISQKNYGQCDQCTAWVVNRDKESEREGVDDEIKDGAVIKSKLLCCDCLPQSHQWHWSNT